MYLAAYEEGGAIGAYVVCRRVDEVADEPVGDVNVVGTVFGGGAFCYQKIDGKPCGRRSACSMWKGAVDPGQPHQNG